jgi:hypothetical protein
MTSQEYVSDNLVPAPIKVAAAQPPLMTIMELLKLAFTAGASTGGTQWTGKLSFEDDNRWVKFANEIQTKASAEHLIKQGWRDMASAPLNGKHCILAIQEDAFIYAVQGAYSYGEWNVVHRGNVKPLCWMPNVRLPAEFLPEGFGKPAMQGKSNQ